MNLAVFGVRFVTANFMIDREGGCVVPAREQPDVPAGPAEHERAGIPRGSRPARRRIV